MRCSRRWRLDVIERGLHVLLGGDERCHQAWATPVAADRAGGRGTAFEPVARLSAAHAHQGLAACELAVTTFDEQAATARTSCTSPGGPDWYDWLELPCTVQAEVSGQHSDRLRER